MREYGGEINFILYVWKLKRWLRSAIQFQSSSLRHSNSLATVTFILDQGSATFPLSRAKNKLGKV